MKKWILACWLVLPFVAEAQFSIDGQVSFTHFTGGTGLKHFGAGIRGEYESTERVGVYGGVNFYLPENYQADIKAYAISGSTDPQELLIPTDSKVSFRDIHVGAKVFYYGRYEADEHKPWGLYVLAEGGLLMGKSVSSLPIYDKDLYWSPVDDEVEGTFINWVGGLGLGVEYYMGRTNIYFDVKSRLTIDEANRQLVRTYVPFGLSYNLGFRFPFEINF